MSHNVYLVGFGQKNSHLEIFQKGRDFKMKSVLTQLLGGWGNLQSAFKFAAGFQGIRK